MTNKDWIIIGISGVTCGGKTTLARRLASVLSPSKIFHQDNYFFPDDSENHIRCEGIEHNNYDILSSLDMPKMYDDILSTISGVDKSSASHSSTETGTLTANGKSFLIVEGFTALNYRKIFELCDLKYYIILNYGECVLRRSLRLYDPPDVEGYFENCVWPEHVRYKTEIEKEPSVTFLSGSDPNIFDSVISDVRKLGATPLNN